jgi:hypothetical protein
MRSYDGRANAVQLILRVRIDPSNPIISNRFSTFTKLSVRHNTRGTGVFGAAKGDPRTNRNNLFFFFFFSLEKRRGAGSVESENQQLDTTLHRLASDCKFGAKTHSWTIIDVHELGSGRQNQAQKWPCLGGPQNISTHHYLGHEWNFDELLSDFQLAEPPAP